MKILKYELYQTTKRGKKEKTKIESFCILGVYWYIFTLYRSFYREIIIDK